MAIAEKSRWFGRGKVSDPPFRSETGCSKWYGRDEVNY